MDIWADSYNAIENASWAHHMDSRKKEERWYGRIDSQATTPATEVPSANSKRVRSTRTTSETDQENEEQGVRIGCYEASCTARGPFLFPVDLLVATIIMSCTCPSSSASFFPSIFAAGSAPQRRFRAPACTFSIRVLSSLSSLVHSCCDCTE